MKKAKHVACTSNGAEAFFKSIEIFYNETVCFTISRVFFELTKLSRQYKDSLLILQNSVDMLYFFLELVEHANIEFSIELGTSLCIVVLRRLEERLTALEVPVAAGALLTFRVKAELKIIFDFVKSILSKTDVISTIYLHYDFTCIRRPLITSILNTSIKVVSSHPRSSD